MDKEAEARIKKLSARTDFLIITAPFGAAFILFAIVLLFYGYFFASAILFALASIPAAHLIFLMREAKREEKEGGFKPVVLSADKSFSFDDVVSIFEGLTDEENRLSTSENVRFFRFNFSFNFIMALPLRVVLYKTDDFNKKDFKNDKDRINKKANKELKISQWVSRYDNKMRLNVIYSKYLTADLYSFLSQNAEHNLRRVEGIINFAVVGNQIILPPLFGDCYDGQIFRYKHIIKFINQVFLNCKS